MRDKFWHRKFLAAGLFAGFHIWATTTSSAIEPAASNTFVRIRVMADAGNPSKSEKVKKPETVRAKDTPSDDKPKRTPDSRSKSAAETNAEPEVEKLVLQLVRSHLPKIEQMLVRLRDSNPAEYQRAIRDLAKSARKLELAKKRDQAMFEIEVEILKARSDVNLLTAKLKLRDGDSDRKSLRRAATQLQQAEMARDEYEIKILEERLATTEHQIDILRERIAAKKRNAESQVEKNYIGYLRKAGHQPGDTPPQDVAIRKKSDAKK